MADKYFQRATQFVATRGRTPFNLGNGTALMADEKPDDKGRYAIRVWEISPDGTIGDPITTVTFWREHNHRLVDWFNISDILQIAMKYDVLK